MRRCCATGSLSGHATDRTSLPDRGRLRRRGGRPGVGSSPARRHRRARVHELGAEHAVVRVARDRGRGRVPDPVRLLREQHAQGLAGRQPAQRQLRLELGQLERGGDAPARRPVRRLRPGPVLVPERPAVLPGRPELVLDGHDARAPRVHDDRPVQADGRASARGATRRSCKTRRSRCGSTSPTTSPARSPRTSSASRSASGRTDLCDTNAGKIYGHNPACSVPGSAGKSTTFTCTADYGAIADGNVWACVIAADASIPDNPNGPEPERHRRQGQPVPAELRRRGARSHAADGRDRRGLDAR